MSANPKQIRIPPLTWKRVRHAAVELDMSASEFVRRSVIRALADFTRTGKLVVDPASENPVIATSQP